MSLPAAFRLRTETRRHARSSSTLALGLALAVVVRALVAGRVGASSLPAAGVFSVILAGLIFAAGWRPGQLRLAWVGAGLAGGAGLVAGALSAHGHLSSSGAGPARLATWAVVVSSVALTEEVLLRGAMWHAIDQEQGPVAALIATSVVFAVMHVPLYGWRAIPLDLGVGLGLGALRLWSGGVTAPAMAHLVADLAGGLW